MVMDMITYTCILKQFFSQMGEEQTYLFELTMESVRISEYFCQIKLGVGLRFGFIEYIIHHDDDQ